MSTWNPISHPWRVLRYRTTSALGMHGWAADVVGVFATKEEAQQAVPAPRCMRKNTMYYTITFAQNAGAWGRRGSWLQVGRKMYPELCLKEGTTRYNRDYMGEQS